jgi:uncharacterized protein (TIGR04255 family)
LHQEVANDGPSRDENTLDEGHLARYSASLGKVETGDKVMPEAISPTPPRQRYKKHFLKQVIARIDFGTPLPIAKLGPPKRVVETLKANFPRAELERVTEQNVTLSPTGSLVDTKDKPRWVYSSKDRRKKTIVAEDHCVVEYVQGSYASFEVLSSEFLSLVAAMFQSFENLQVNRLGLRYVNSIELDEDNPMDWSKYLSLPLLALPKLATDPTTLSRVFHLVEFNYGDTNLRFQGGMVNPDYPAPIKRKQFVLDYDAYCQLLLSEQEIQTYLRQFHAKVNAAFEEVITPELRKKMEIVDEQ